MGIHHANAVNIRMRLHISNDISIRDPLGHHLEGIDRNTKALKDVWMSQSHPHHNLPVEFLRDVNQPWYQAKVEAFTHFLRPPEFHHLDLYIILIGTPLHRVELPHPYLGALVHFKCTIIWFVEAIRD